MKSIKCETCGGMVNLEPMPTDKEMVDWLCYRRAAARWIATNPDITREAIVAQMRRDVGWRMTLL